MLVKAAGIALHLLFFGLAFRRPALGSARKLLK